MENLCNIMIAEHEGRAPFDHHHMDDDDNRDDWVVVLAKKSTWKFVIKLVNRNITQIKVEYLALELFY